MYDDSTAFLSRAFLRSRYDVEFRVFVEEGGDEALLKRLRLWNERLALSETQAESAFISTFFEDLWGYAQSGKQEVDKHTIIPKYPVRGAGAGGGAGQADLALGWFKGAFDVPQAICEFKDVASDLDAPQHRKGDRKTPVQQCLNYVRAKRAETYGNEPVQTWFGLVTDMNEFRLYWWDRAPREYLRFVIRRRDLFAAAYDLLSDGEDARFDRFLFTKLFHRDMLLSQVGKPTLLTLVERQGAREKKIEEDFYGNYKATRERLFGVLSLHNQSYADRKGELMRLTQRLLDRFIFAYYCEDMGERMLFPPQFVRDHMGSRSAEPHYDPAGDEFWDFFKRMFAALDRGGKLGTLSLPHVNGGLFEADPRIDALVIPNHVFAAAGQGKGVAALEGDKATLYYLSARYNYASEGDAKESLSLYTLGRIFEQSITELEYRIGELEDRDTIAKLSKRKRDGVYYTPEWVVNYLVDETLGPWFDAAKARAGFAEGEAAPTLAQWSSYESALARIRIVDPACGSGAFLISAFRRLLKERTEAAREILRLGSVGLSARPDEAALIAQVLSENIYGVDINPSSVEIAKLALWLHSARAAAPLSSLDKTLRCGNSLVGLDFWRGRAGDAAARERVNAFDWNVAFPEVFAQGGFDVVLGNPPYVKLQNLMKVDPDVVAFLAAQRGEDTYRSAQTGNFDLYLPFIEKGLRLLAPAGRMAYIAPSLWAANEYGAGLRTQVSQTRQLERWVDFKSFQVFDEAITYTALQFFTREPNTSLRIAQAHDGDVADIDWTAPGSAIPYEEFPAGSEWLMLAGKERALVTRLWRDCLRLADPEMTSAIFQGLVTSADTVFHLRRLGANRYECLPKKQTPYEVEIEDAIMRPLVSGKEAKRYESPETSTYLLFPYERGAAGDMVLIPQPLMRKRFSKTWAYLTSYEKELRGRESGKMDADDKWWGYVYPKSLDKNGLNKLFVAQTVPALRVMGDFGGEYYANNVRVNCILPAPGRDLAFLLGVLNGPVADFIFRRIGKPKQGGWFEANRQFIAPLPVPRATPARQADVAARARALQELWTRRRALLGEAGDRLRALGRARHPPQWLWPDLPTREQVDAEVPRQLRTYVDERRAWVKDRLAALEDAKIAALAVQLKRGETAVVRFARGALTLAFGDAEPALTVFLDAPDGRLIGAYWRHLLIAQSRRDPKSLADDLRRTPIGPDTPAARQFVERVANLTGVEREIADAEAAMNEILYNLYGLTDKERQLVENDCKRLRSS